MAQDQAPTYEAGLSQKPGIMDSKAPIQISCQKAAGPKLAESSNRGGEGYYFNVAQKGKLILPTALWILLIIAGVCFLTLLASLNRTINTLDTLVEIEQNKEARAIHAESSSSYHHHFQQQQQQLDRNGEPKPKRSRKDSSNNSNKSNGVKEKASSKGMNFNRLNEDSIADLEPVEDSARPNGWFFPIEPSWFSMPSWTSLEPVRPVMQAGPFLEGPFQRAPFSAPPVGLMDSLMGADLPAPDVIMIREDPFEQHPDGASAIHSLLKQVVPMFEGAARSEEEASLKRAPNQRIGASGGEPPAVVSAKIENLHVNINPAASHGASGGKKQSREEEINSLEKSIDDLISKLIDQKTLPQKSHQQLAGPIQRLESQTDASVPIVLNEVHHRRPSVRPFSPLASLLLPPPIGHQFEQDPSSMLMKALAGDELLAPKSSRHRGKPSRGPADAQLIISISDDEEPRRPSGETNRHHVSNTRRPSVAQSPYEFPTSLMNDILMNNPFEMISPKSGPFSPSNDERFHDNHVTKAGKTSGAPWDMLASDLAQAVIGDALNPSKKQANRREKPAEEGPTQLLFIDGMPVAPGEQSSVISTILGPDNLVMPMSLFHPDHVHKAADKDKQTEISFEPLTLGSKLIVSDEKKEEDGAGGAPQVELTSSSSKSEQTDSTLVDQTTTRTEQAPSSSKSSPGLDSIKSRPEPSDASGVDSIFSPSSFLTSDDKTAEDERGARNDALELMNEFMESMISLPQMAGESQQTRIAEPPRPSGGGPSETKTQTVETTSEAVSTSASSPWTLKDAHRPNTTSSSKSDSMFNSLFSKVIGFFKDPRGALKKTDEKRANASSNTTPAPKATATRLTTSISNAPIVEMVEERDTPQELPIIDLSPFAKSSKPFAQEARQALDLAKNIGMPSGQTGEGTSAAPNVTALPDSSTSSASSSTATTTTTTTTPNPRVVALKLDESPPKSFLGKADEFLENNLLNLKKMFHTAKERA